MSLRTRRPDPPTIAALPEQDADRFIAVLRDELNLANQERKGLEQERDQLADEADRLVDERDGLLHERYDLAHRILPHLVTPTWPQTAEPVDALCYDEMAERLDFKPDLRTDGDDVNWAEQIRRFGDAVACENPDPRRDQ